NACKEDLLIIESDYNKIVSKIKQGKAHELSEGDTVYLGACTKGATAEKSLKPQFYNAEIPAKRRAFCLKQGYMTYLINT
ncbi:restriction endonuclease, partial [Listeria monocytogenes]|nr:restriction endonuclease [Listeria monocytogenes]